MTAVLPAASEAQILSYFKDAAKQLADIVERANTGTTFYRYRLDQLHAIADVIKRLDANSKEWVQENIPLVMEQAADAVKQEIAKQGENDFSFRFAGVPEDAVKVLTQQSYLDFSNTATLLTKNSQRAALNKLAVQRKIIQGTIQGQSVGKTQAEILAGLRQDISVVQYKNGAKVPLETYINMLVRTQTMNAYNVAGTQQMLAAGRLFAIFPTIPALNRPPDDPCWKWEKIRFINLRDGPIPPLHPNCRHSLQPVSLAQLKAERPDLYRESLIYFGSVSGGK